MVSHPWDDASCANRFWLLWLWPVLKKGAKAPLREADIYELPSHLKASSLDAQWYRCIEPKIATSSQVSILRILLRAFGWRYAVILFVFSCWLGSLSLLPVLTDSLFKWLKSERSILEGLVWSTSLVVAYLGNCNAGCQWYQQTTQLGYEFRASAAMLVFRRTLQMSLQDPTKDKAMNLMQVDAERLFLFAQLSHLLFTALIVVAMASVYLISYEGWDICIVSISVVVLTMIFQSLMTRVAAPARQRMQRWSDERIALLAQILDAMRVLKMYGWTRELGLRVQKFRRLELKSATLYLGLRACSSALLFCAPLFSMVAVLALLHGRSEPLYAERVFLIFTIVGLARAPLGGVAIGAAAVVDGRAAFRRLSDFVAPCKGCDIFRADLRSASPAADMEPEPAMAAVQGRFTHSLDSSFKLSVDLGLKTGELVAICGPVASGKSSLLLSLLGEIAAEAGGSKLPTGTAYFAQAPWIRSGTVRNAIIQDLPVNDVQYWRAVRAAQLVPDLAVWAGGESTYVGSRGVTLSGGQRARLGLAHLLYRCLVSEVNLVLMDDVFAAVDVHVARAICEEAILGIIVDQRRTVLMVMNSNFVALQAADRIVALEDGQAHVYDGVEQWLEACSPAVKTSCEQTMTQVTGRVLEDQVPPVHKDEDLPKEKKEVSKVGSLQIRTFTYYFGSGHSAHGLFLMGLIIIVMIIVEALRIYVDYFMGQWAERDAENSEADSNEDFRSYLLWAGVAVVGMFFRAILFVATAARASHKIHNLLLERLLSAPMSYFDSMPAGRILGHFSKDLDALDALLPQFGLDFAQDVTLLLGVVCVCVWSTPPAAAAVVPVLFCFYKIRTFFSRTARETKRLDGVTRGPLYSAIGDIAEGLATLRAHKQAGNLVKAFQELVDYNGKIFFQTYILQPWCILVLDSLGASIVLITATFCVLLRGSLGVGTATMAISYALMTRGKMQFCVRLSIEAENQMIAAERLQVFEQSLPSENSGGQNVEESWPERGCVSFQDVRMRYRPDLPWVLQGLSIDVQPGTKVGVVGRTGSGKSSLFSALLRIAEVEAGSILLDGVDIHTVCLQRLRSAISIIPQDPILWSGSLAANLDPAERIPDSRLLDAVDKVGLGPALEDLGGLRAMVDSRGSNLSLGQRQLLCIARCIVRRSRVVLADEATACVDGATDSFIQEAFRSQFRDCTMLVVAHRIQTIMDADRVLVLEAGKVVETGCPKALCADVSSRFAALAELPSSKWASLACAFTSKFEDSLDRSALKVSL